MLKQALSCKIAEFQLWVENLPSSRTGMCIWKHNLHVWLTIMCPMLVRLSSSSNRRTWGYQDKPELRSYEESNYSTNMNQINKSLQLMLICFILPLLEKVRLEHLSAAFSTCLFTAMRAWAGAQWLGIRHWCTSSLRALTMKVYQMNKQICELTSLLVNTCYLLHWNRSGVVVQPNPHFVPIELEVLY